ncbi:unnamed protein product, partial [marine sediment metagenome]
MRRISGAVAAVALCAISYALGHPADALSIKIIQILLMLA